MSEVGKSAKYMGLLHPRVIKRLDPVPGKATPPRTPSKPKKRYGYSYEHRRWNSSGFGETLFRCWFRTQKSRDQAMEKAERDSLTWCKTLNDMRFARGIEPEVEPWTRNYQPINRK